MKGRVVQILRTQGGVVSGEALSAALGVSRVSIWKHVRALQTAGYAIRASAKGYRLEGSPDVLFPWEFPGREGRVHHDAETGSTMDTARKLARQGCPAFSVVTADRQRAGRGRLKRTWLSPPGGLYFTVVLRPDVPAVISPRFSFGASVALAVTLREMFDVDARLKWPNDVLIGGRKVAGILSEMEAEADLVTFLNIGVGLNVNNDPPVGMGEAASLGEILGRRLSRRDILSGFLDRFEPRVQPDRLDRVMADWKALALTLDRPVRINTPQGGVEGLAVDVDENGALLLRRPDGSVTRIYCGDCRHE